MSTSYNEYLVYSLTIKTNVIVMRNAKTALTDYLIELEKNGKSDVYIYADRVVIEDTDYQRLGRVGYFISDMLKRAQEGKIVFGFNEDGLYQISLA